MPKLSSSTAPEAETDGADFEAPPEFAPQTRRKVTPKPRRAKSEASSEANSPERPAARDRDWNTETPSSRLERGGLELIPKTRRAPRETTPPLPFDGERVSHANRLVRKPSGTLIFEVAGVLLLALGALLLFNALMPHAEGWLPKVAVSGLRLAFGLGAVVFPLLLCALGLMLIVQRRQANLRAFFSGVLLGFPVFLTAIHLQVPMNREFAPVDLIWQRGAADSGFADAYDHGGAVGAVIAWALRKMLGEPGAVIALVALAIVALLLLTEMSLAETVGNAGRGMKRGAHRAGRKTRRVWQRGVEIAYQEPEPVRESFSVGDPFARQLSRNGERNGSSAREESPPFVESVPPTLSPRETRELARSPQSFKAVELPIPTRVPRRASPFLPLDDLLRELPPVAAMTAHVETLAPEIKLVPDSNEAAPKPPAKTAKVVEPIAPRIEIIDAPPPPSILETSSEAAREAEPVPINRPDDVLSPSEALEAQALASAKDEPLGIIRKRARPAGPRRRFGDGPYMPEYFDDAVRALDPPVRMDVSGAEEDIQLGVQNVTETLASFKIDARVTDVKRGPVITRYEVQPAPGVRVAAIANLDRDLARSLSAIAVRIEAPVPGKNVVGIEVPNRKVHLVRLRDVLELPEFLSAQSKLGFVLGKDIAGQPKWADLTKMPHLLIAGATNSGKSVCLNTLITSIITRATPEEVKFSLIDPKRVELTLYRDIPHLYHPVVVEPKEAVRALRGMITEMDRRYKRFAERGVRNIASYNGKLEDGEAPLPYIVIVIDELADLMMTAAAEFEKLICRLAQLARATGIHLIVATQRPSVNVITGVIKANIPARIAFAVASQVDSRTILDSVGAERLIGSGDMLFDANNGGKAVRIQGAYLSEEEVNRIVQVVKTSYAGEDFEYGMDLSAIDDSEDTPSNDRSPSEDKRDELYDQIKEFVLRHQEMSASNIQRKYEIGYPRAGRIVDQLERDGILGPADGPKPRKVLGNG